MSRISKPKIRKWIEALRSGDYKQSRQSLYNPEENGFCCLGVYKREVDGVSTNYLRGEFDGRNRDSTYQGLREGLKIFDIDVRGS